jgi:hypothetical protein
VILDRLAEVHGKRLGQAGAVGVPVPCHSYLVPFLSTRIGFIFMSLFVNIAFVL